MKAPSRIPLIIVVGLTACTWFAVGVVFFGVKPEIGFFKPLSIVTGVLATAIAAFDRWLWKIRGLSALHGVPNLNGTWTGEIRSTEPDPATGKNKKPIPAAMVIRHTFTSISVRMFTEESSSVSVAAGVTLELDGHAVVSYIFRNEPHLLIQGRSRVHHGGSRLALGGDGDVLEGSYWTDRDTKGEMTLRRVSRIQVLDFDSAQRLNPDQVGRSRG